MSKDTHRSLEEGQRLVALLRSHFLNREDKVAAKMRWGKPHPVQGLDNLPGLLLAHIMGEDSPHAGLARYESKDGAIKAQSGHFRIGSYTPDEEGNTRWLCLDFDGEGHSDPLEDPEAAARLTQASFTSVGIPSYLEQSGGGKGWHLWVFFSGPTPAKLVRQLAHRLIPSNLPLANGRGVAMPRSNRGVETFPKTAKAATPKRLGNLVWLPWFHGAPEGANEFYREKDGALVPYTPETFETIDQATVEQHLADLEAAPVAPASSAPASSRTHVDEAALEEFLRRATKEDDARQPPSTDWRTWKEKALALLDLERVYGLWLTGERAGEHWLQCQDPDSPSGADSKSGNVAEGSGTALRGTFHSWRTEETFSVFDFMVHRGQATSFLDAARQIAEWTGVPLPGARAPQPLGRRLLPVIVVNSRQVRDIVEEAKGVIEEVNSRIPFLFQQDRRFLRVVESPKGAYAEEVNEQTVYGFLIRLADWVRRTDDGDEHASPSHEISRDLVVNPPSNLHPLEMIVTSPVFTASKQLLTQPGYDRESGIWYWQARDMGHLTVPTDPTPEDVRAALSLLLDELLVDFPFQSPADLSHALASLLLPFMKPMIHGLCPIHLIEAPAIGSGKSLLAKLVHVIATGRQAPITTMGRDEEETRKKVTSLLATGSRIVIIDNVLLGISSANLAAAITSEVWKDRWLGTQEMPELSNNAIWFFTGNNPDLSLEIARRCVRIRIESPDERPWLRKDFKHDPIEDWAVENRAELVQAILVLVQSWVRAGSPHADVAMGSFQQWARIMGGLLQFHGVPGFLDNRTEMFENADATESEWRAFVQVWWDEFGGVPVQTSDLRRLAQENDLLSACRGTKDDSSQTIRLGKEVRRQRGRRFGDYRIVLGRPARNKTNRWTLVRISDGDSGPDSDPSGTDGDQDAGATVTDLFSGWQDNSRSGTLAGQSARGTETQPPAQPPARQSRTTGGPRGVAGGAGGDPGATWCASTQCAHTRTMHTRNAQGVLDNSLHSPRPPAEPTVSGGCGAGGSAGGSPRTHREPPAHHPADQVDLAEFTDTEDE